MTRDEFISIFARERARFAHVYPRLSTSQLVFITGPCSLPESCSYRDFAYALPEEAPPKVVFNERILGHPWWNAVALIRHELGHLADDRVANVGREQVADDIAEFVTGERINYNDRDVQTMQAGTYPRPPWIHG